MFQALTRAGYQVEYTSHAQAILKTDFPDCATELERALADFKIPVLELVESGGGEARATQRLRGKLTDLSWRKRNVTIRKTVDGVEKEAISHEIDHVRKYEHGDIALEIEWNNKDPFFDRDLENFKRLHGEGVFSVGVIITRGESLQAGFRDRIAEFATRRRAAGFDAFQAINYRPTERFQRDVLARVAAGRPFAEAWSSLFCSDKYGEATTHWRKLMDRVHRGVGNPCPMVLIGIPIGVVEPEAAAP